MNYIWLILIFIVVFLILFSYQMNIIFKARNKLYDDCDPNPYQRMAQDKLRTTDSRSNAYTVYQMDLASVMLIKGDYHGASEILRSIDSNKLKKKVLQLCYLNNMLCLHCLLGEMEEAHHTKIRLAQLSEDFKYPIRKQYEQVRISINNTIATYELMCGNLEISRRIYMADLHSKYSNSFFCTVTHYYLGQIYEREQQLDQALEHYETSYCKAQHFYFYDALNERISKLKMSIQEQSGSL